MNNEWFCSHHKKHMEWENTELYKETHWEAFNFAVVESNSILSVYPKVGRFDLGPFLF